MMSYKMIHQFLGARISWSPKQKLDLISLCPDNGSIAPRSACIAKTCEIEMPFNPLQRGFIDATTSPGAAEWQFSMKVFTTSAFRSLDAAAYEDPKDPISAKNHCFLFK